MHTSHRTRIGEVQLAPISVKTAAPPPPQAPAAQQANNPPWDPLGLSAAWQRSPLGRSIGELLGMGNANTTPSTSSSSRSPSQQSTSQGPPRQGTQLPQPSRQPYPSPHGAAPTAANGGAPTYPQVSLSS